MRFHLPLLTAVLLIAAPALAHDGHGVPWAHEHAAPLTVTEQAGVDRVNAPVTGGVPVGPLGVKSVDELMLTTAAGDPIPAQISPTVTGPDGRLDWVLVDFLTDLPAGQAKGFKLKAGKTGKNVPGAIDHPVAVEQTDDTVTLSNGVAKIVISKKKFNLFEAAWIDRNGNGRFEDDEQLLAAGDKAPAAFTLIRGTDEAEFTSRGGKVENVVLEDAGFVRSTVLLEGTFAGEKGEHLKWNCRVTMWAGQPDVRALLAIRNVNPKVAGQEPIRRASVRIKLGDLAGNAHYLVGAERVKMSQISNGPKGVYKSSQWHNKVQLEQMGPSEPILSRTQRIMHAVTIYDTAGYRVRMFQPGNREPVADVGFKCRGWIDLSGDNGGVGVWLRNFTHDNPKLMEATADGDIRVDVIPEVAGSAQPYYKDGSYWLGDRSYRTYELNFHLHGRPLTAEADWKKFRSGFMSYIEPTEQTSERAEAIVTAARNRLQLRIDPEYLTDSGQLWGPVVPLADEAAAAKALGRTLGEPSPLGSDALGTEFLHYENFHYRSEWDEPRDAIAEYMRTGHPFLLTRAHSFARNYRDLGVWRTDGQPMNGRAEGKNPKGAGPIPRWGQFCGCHHYGAGLIDMWLLTGDRSYRDAGMDWAYAMAANEDTYGGFGNRHWGRRQAAVLRAYHVNFDPKLKQWLTDAIPLPPNDALRADGRALIMGTKMASWMAGLSMHGLWHYYLTFRDEMDPLTREQYEDAIVGVARQVAKYWYFPEHGGGPYHFNFDQPKPGDVTTNGGGGPYTLSCIDMMTRGYLLTGDKRLLDQATLFWKLICGDDEKVMGARLEDFTGMGSHTFWARQLIHELAHPRKDAAAPAAVADLKAEPLGGGKVKLTWTAPADEGGKVVRYQLKHAPLPMVEYEAYTYPADHGQQWTWWAGYNVTGEPAPAAGGSAQSMVVENVPAGVRHFAVRSYDDSSNQSPLSNIAKVEVK